MKDMLGMGVCGHLNMLEVNKRDVFRSPRREHLVSDSLSPNVTGGVLSLTGYSTQMCYSVNTRRSVDPTHTSQSVREQHLATT